jgi:hypothetical protein
VPNWSISKNYKNIWNSTKDSVTTEMFVTRRPCGAKPRVKGAQGLASRPDFKSVQAKTSWLCSHISSEEDPMLESQWKPGGLAGQPCGWSSDSPSPPN